MYEDVLQELFYYIDTYEDVSQELKEFRELFNFIYVEEERKTLQKFRRVKEYFRYIDAYEDVSQELKEFREFKEVFYLINADEDVSSRYSSRDSHRLDSTKE